MQIRKLPQSLPQQLGMAVRSWVVVEFVIARSPRSGRRSKALPILAAVAIDSVGKDSHGQKIIRRKDTDKPVVYVK